MKLESIAKICVALLASVSWAAEGEQKEQAAGEFDPRYNRISSERSGYPSAHHHHHHHHHHHQPHHSHHHHETSESSSSSTTHEHKPCHKSSDSHHHKPCHKESSSTTSESSSSSSSSSHCPNPFQPPHRHSHSHHGHCHPHHHHSSSSSSSHYHDHCHPDQAQAKVLQLTALMQQYLSTCPLGPFPSALVNPFATVGLYTHNCQNGNPSCCYYNMNFQTWALDYYTALCLAPASVSWINQQPPSAQFLGNGTAIVTFVEVDNTLNLSTNQVRFYWQRRVGCDYWLQYVERKDVTCSSYVSVPFCNNCPPV